jgi:uncharacterized protein (DUF58 family)
MNPRLLKIVLALLLFLCLLPMPYGYYELVRWAAMLGFAFLAYQAYERKDNILLIVFIGLALLFQPFAKLSLGRELVEHRRCGGGGRADWQLVGQVERRGRGMNIGAKG